MITRTALIVLAASGASCLAQDADALFSKMLDHYQQLKGCSVDMALEVRSEDPAFAPFIEAMGQKTPGWTVKPNRFAFWSPEERSDAGMPPSPNVYSDGEQLITAVPAMSIYSVEDAPQDFAALIEANKDSSDAAWQMLPGAAFVLSLMAPEPGETLGQFLSDVEYVRAEGEGADACHVLSTTQTENGQAIGLEMRIRAEGEPWLVSLTPNLDDMGTPPGLEIVMTFNEWKQISDAPEKGAIEPQDDWKKVDSVIQAMMAEMGGGDPAASPRSEEQSVGQGEEAPQFTLPLLGTEEEFSLASKRGQVVVLDFWATWCPPCIKGLPTVTEVTGQYADKGVVFAAVNLQEDPGHVAKFMKNKGWDFTVPLDQEGDVAGKFGVTGIPHSVIIDKKGVIRHVHVGFGDADEYAKQLRSELDALVAEK